MEGRRVDEGPTGRFLVDGTLGRLARNLRMLGYDAVYGPGDQEALVERAAREGRWLLTRKRVDRRWEGNICALQILHEAPHEQIVEVLRVLSVALPRSLWFSRCLRCNRLLEEISWERAREMVPEYVSHSHRRFRCCPGCGRIFWAGTHSFRMRETMERWVTEARNRKGEGPSSECHR